MKKVVPMLEGRAPAAGWFKAAFPLLALLGRAYGGIMALRARLFRAGLFLSYGASKPVICIGNLSAGGTGKTPFTLWLAQQLLQKMEEEQLAIVSRGYGQRSKEDVLVVGNRKGLMARPPTAGDEAFLLANRLPGSTVITSPDRALGIQMAINLYEAEVILMDDGFQHLKVKRNLDIVLLDATNPLGNGHILPAGILRESTAALSRAGIIVLTRAFDKERAEQSRERIAALAPGVPIVTADYGVKDWQWLEGEGVAASPQWRTEKTLAFSGIAQPEAFHRTLEETDLPVVDTVSFPDHHDFNRKSLAELQKRAVEKGAVQLACTEKDAVKIDPAWLTMPAIFPRIEMRVEEDGKAVMDAVERTLA